MLGNDLDQALSGAECLVGLNAIRKYHDNLLKDSEEWKAVDTTINLLKQELYTVMYGGVVYA